MSKQDIGFGLFAENIEIAREKIIQVQNFDGEQCVYLNAGNIIALVELAKKAGMGITEADLV